MDAQSLDIDHCLPWSAWPCGDLWNLLPAHRTVTQHQKRDRLPAVALLRAAGDPIQEWWRRGYLEVRFVRRHRIPLIEIKRGVYRITAAAVLQIEEAGQTHPATMSLRIESRPLHKLQVRSRTSAFESVLALTTSILRAKKPLK